LPPPAAIKPYRYGWLSKKNTSHFSRSQLVKWVILIPGI
jgi:hypothetical protein